MKQLLSLFLIFLPCLAWAQYPSNGNQKITLGEQTSADGLIFRGVASIDTVTATSKITRANKQDTSAYLLLDTVTNLLWHYKIGSNGWSQAGGGTAVTTFSGGTTGLTPNTATSGAVTLGGTLAVANGGTGLTTFTASNRIPYTSSATALTTSSNLIYNNSTLVIGNENDNYDNLSLKNKATTSNTTRRIGMTANTFENDSLIGLMSVYADASSRAIVFGGGVSNLKNPTEINFFTSTNVENPANRGARLRMFINDIGNVGIGTASPSRKLIVYDTDSNVSTIGLRTDGSGISTTDGFDLQFASSNTFLFNRENGYMAFGTNNNERMQITSGGEIYVAPTTDRGAYNLQVNGTGVWGEGAYVNGSDANIKENIIDLDSSLNIVNNLKPVVFNYINASVNNYTKHLGFIAQDVYQTLENKDYLGSIVRSDGETLSIAYSNIIPLLTKAIQEQQALIKALEQRIINLENK
jgi:hypothetical protein